MAFSKRANSKNFPINENKENEAPKKWSNKKNKIEEDSHITISLNNQAKKSNNTVKKRSRTPLKEITTISRNNVLAEKKTEKKSMNIIKKGKTPEDLQLDFVSELPMKNLNPIRGEYCIDNLRNPQTAFPGELCTKHLNSIRGDYSNDETDDFSFLKNEDFENLSLTNLPLIESHKIIIKEKEIKHNESIGCTTPSNAYFSHLPIINIKEIRKNILKCSHLAQKHPEKLNPDTKQLKISSNIEGEQKRLSIFNDESFNYIRENVEEKLFISPDFYIKPGVVYWDPRENYVFQDVLYSYPYFKYIVEYQLEKESNYKLSEEFLKKYVITSSNRSIVINWLIKLQAYIRTEHSLVYTAIRMMDLAIDSHEIPLNKLQLVALASFWISLKYHAVNHRGSSWMVKQSGGAYTCRELIEMELQVLKVNKFNVNTIDLTVYVNYYLYHLKVSNADIVVQCAHYLLDCAFLESRFVRVLPSVLAAAAVYAALSLMKQFNRETWCALRFRRSYYRPEELEPIKNDLIEILKEVNGPRFQCREPYYKFASSRHCNVSFIIRDALFG